MRSLTSVQRFLLVLVAVLAAGALILAGWLVVKSEGSREQAAPADILPTSQNPHATVTALPEPLEHTAIPPTATQPPLVMPTDSSPTACLPLHSVRTQARVLEVLAVNRIRVEVDGQEWEVVYLGVDPAGAQEPALAANQALVEGKTVILVQDAVDTDSQGSRLRYVLSGETLVNYSLIREGMAITALSPPGIACDAVFLDGERAAQIDRVGFWAMAVPTQKPAGLTTLGAPPCPCDTSFTCGDFSLREAAQACYNACGDYRNAALDEDHDGLACEDLP